MPIYDSKPWLRRYDPDQPAEISPEVTDALSMFRASVDRNPDGDSIRYFGGRITARDLDEFSDAFAVALLEQGLRAGDRVALYLQNVPQFVIGHGAGVGRVDHVVDLERRGGAERLAAGVLLGDQLLVTRPAVLAA